MSRGKKVISLFLACLLSLGQLAGCAPKEKTAKDKGTAVNGNAPSYLNLSGFPIVKQPITLKAMAKVVGNQAGNYGNILVWQEYEKMTGIKIDWEEVPQASVGEKKNLAIASNELPDFFYRIGFSENEKLQYGEAGTILKLNDLIDKYGPNFKGFLEANPDAKKSIPSYNGEIYAMATFNDGMAFQISPKMFINKKWLDAVGMKSPTTTDELYSTLKAFKERDPNGNGKADEVPWTGWGYRDKVIETLKGSFGLGNRGETHGDADIDPQTGKIRYQWIAPEFKDLLAYVGKLYQEGLLDKEIITISKDKVIKKAQQNTIGMVNAANIEMLGNEPTQDFVGLPGAFKGPKGDQFYAATGSKIGGRGPFVITSANKYPEATMRWIDYFYSEEGVKFFYMGVEGKTYYKTPDGNYEYLPEIVNNIPEGSTFDDVINKYTPYGGGGSPTIVMTKYFKGGETQPKTMEAVKNLTPYAPKEIWGPFNYTAEELDRFSQLSGDINGYVNQMMPKFITGQESLTGWDTYVAQVKKLGLDEYLKLYETAYERYKKQ